MTASSRRQVLAGLAAALVPLRASHTSTRPNIILLMADDQGWGDTSYNGHPILRTPNTDDMARSGVRFNRFYAGAPVCSPTRGSCLTGRHPFRYGIFFANAGGPGQRSQYRLPHQEVTLASLLGKAGYRTGHFGKWHLGDFEGPMKTSPSDVGFDEWFSTVRKVPTVDPPLGEYWENGKPVTTKLEGDDTQIIMDRALRFIGGAVRRKQPYCAVIWTHTPHRPVLATSDFRKPFAAYSKEEQNYWGAMTALDFQLGRLRRELRNFGTAADTMLWYASDNGPEGDQQDPNFPGSAGPFRGRKTSLFEGGIRVPGLLEWPSRIPKPRVVESAASTLDYFPTVLDALDLHPPDHRPLDGLSLMPVLFGRDRVRPKPLNFETSRITRGSPRLAMIDGRMKLLTNLTDEPDLLYDLESDPGEKQNLVAQRPEERLRMRSALEVWRESCRKSNRGEDYR